jgi:hypothetical protein
VLTDSITALPTGSISRTYIDGDLHKIGKAKSLGTGGGIIRLSRDDDVLEGLFLGEGIETCLAAAAQPDLACRPIWACGSASAMAAFPVLAGIECLSIIADHDANGAGERAARETAERWLGQGRDVRIIRPEKTGDLNDVLKRRGGR